MDLKRRFLLKGALASGASSLLIGGSGLAQAALNLKNEALVTTLLLTSEAAVDASFGAGVKATLPTGASFSAIRTDLTDPHPFVERALQSGRRVRLIGMVDDASGELLVAQARFAGARMSWLGQHGADAHETRHQVINSQGTQGAALSLGEQLMRSSAGYTLTSEQLLSTSSRLALTLNRVGVASDRWAAHLGHALAAPDVRVISAHLPAHSEPLKGRFVTFVIEV